MRYTALLAILAIAFAAPAPEHQVVIDNPATYNEHEVNTQHVEVNLYLNGAEKPPVDTSTAFRCFYCGNQATNDLRTTAVCNTAGGKTTPCGSKEDGLGCVNSKYTQAQFARQCGIVGCISDVKTCSSSKPSVQEEIHLSDNNNNPSLPQRCHQCGSQGTDDEKTAVLCGKSGGIPRSCATKGPLSCVNSKWGNKKFAYECGQIGCAANVQPCPSSLELDDQKETPGFDANIQTPLRRCTGCESNKNDEVTAKVCCQSSKATVQACEFRNVVACRAPGLSEIDFGKKCAEFKCSAGSVSCPPKPTIAQEEVTIFDEPQTSPVEVKVYVNEL